MKKRNNEALKQLARANNAKVSGSKVELVARLADFKMWGSIPKCEACGGGTPVVTYTQRWGHGGQGEWRCKGYFDDGVFQPCHDKPAAVERIPWVDS